MATEPHAWRARPTPARLYPTAWNAPASSDAIRAACQRIAAAWSLGDVAALADALAEDCDHMTLSRVRQVKRGRTALLASWMEAFARRSTDFSVRMTAAVHAVRLLSDDLALVDGTLDYSSGIGAGGTTQGRSSQPFAAIMSRSDESWLIVSLRVGPSSAATKVITCSDQEPQE